MNFHAELTIILNTTMKKRALDFYKVILLTLLILSSTIIFAARDPAVNIKFEHLSVGQGLSQNTISCILQDKKGFMWFSTQHGLNRYDGHTFKWYVNDPGNPKSLSNNVVISLYEDSNETLWVGTWGGGLNKFDRKNEEFTVYKNNSEKPESLSDDNVWSIFEDNSHVLWIGTEKGLNKFDRKKGKFTHHLGKSRINAIYQDELGILWVGSDDGLYILKDNFIKFKCKDNSRDHILKKVKAISESSDGRLWIGTERGLYELNREKEKSNCYNEINAELKQLTDKRVSSIVEDQNHILWIGTRKDGLFYFEPEAKKYTSCKHTYGDPDSLSQNDILSIYESKSGLIWVGTNGGGINFFDPKRRKFDLYRHNPNNHESLSNNHVTAICEGDNGIIWVGTTGEGIDSFYPKEKKFTNYKIPDEVSASLRRNDVRTICKDHSRKIWIGTVRAGLYLFDPEKKGFFHYKKGTLGEEEYILTIYEDKEHVLWVGSMENGLFKIAEDRKGCENYRSDPGNPDSISDNKIFSIYEDKSGTLWIGTGGGGLNKFDRITGKFTSYKHSKKIPHSISHNFITAIYEDHKGILWIGTNGGGLNKFDRDKEIFTVYTTKDGLPDDVIYDIREDNSSNLWISTNKGLSRFYPDPINPKFRNYTVRDELQAYEFSRGAALKTESGVMYFGGVNGLNSFDPKEMKSKDRTQPPKIVFTSFKNHIGVETLYTSITEIEEMNFSHKNKFISFEFAALSYVDPGRNQYAYKLESVTKEWINLGNKHSIDLINLEPGNYTLKVRGSNNDGAWNVDGVSKRIVIKPPFWTTWWFYLIIASLLISTTSTLILLRIKNVMEDTRRLQQAEELYRTLVETSPDGIILSDTKGKIIKTNPQSAILLGYSSVDEMLAKGKTTFSHIAKLDRERVQKKAEWVLKTGKNRSEEYMLQSKDGTLIPVETSTASVKSEGKPTYLLSVIRDTRERKLQQEKLIQADKMISLGTLVSGVAHELNNPAGAIMMNAANFSRAWKEIVPILDQHYRENGDFLLTGLPYKESKREMFELIEGLLNGSRRIKDFIRDLRDFSRPDDSQKLKKVNINNVIQSSVKLTKKLIERTTNHFSLKLADDLPEILGSSRKLEQVLINLIQNACQALPDKNKGIYISTAYNPKTGQIKIFVKDEGEGIEEKNIMHITDPFFTTKRKRTDSGSGLGLFVSLRIVRDHGGFMRFKSSPGKGTNVFVYLPVKKAKEKPHEIETPGSKRYKDEEVA